MVDSAPTHAPVWIRPLESGDTPAGYRQCVVCGDHDYHEVKAHDGEGTEIENPAPRPTVPVVTQ